MGNVTYQWDNAVIENILSEQIEVSLSDKPSIKNRRKYPRLKLNNQCQITVKGGKTFEGEMVNISANGIAFTVKNAQFAMSDILKFKVLGFKIDKELTAVVIRETNLNGKKQYSCRMLDDDADVAKYVEECLLKEVRFK